MGTVQGKQMPIQTLLIDDDPDLAAVLQTLLRGQDFDLHSVLTGAPKTVSTE